MSDYIFSNSQQEKGKLANKIQSIYQESSPKVFEFHGSWGSLAVSQQHYNGFLPFENESHICVVLGAPALYFTDNSFLTLEDSSIATEKIYLRWIVEENMCWDKDLSGPFSVLVIDKINNSFRVVTDLMAFIPVYSCAKNGKVYLGSHVDALAKACEEENHLDEVSLADFILNSVITFPFTLYSNIKQLRPGTIYQWKDSEKNIESYYWTPIEEFNFKNIDEAAKKLSLGIKHYVSTIAQSMSKTAQFISAGEDSRALSGMLPQDKPRDSYVFLDSMNREGIIAKKIADIYGSTFNVGYRSKTYYIDILPESARLIGSGHQYTHAHSLGFYKKYRLDEYPAVFGGFLADTLLKGNYVSKIRGSAHIPFAPQIQNNRSPVGIRFRHQAEFVDSKIVAEIKKRQQEHLNFIKTIRPNSYHEWFYLYPLNMILGISNYHSTRRLFKSYEPFTCSEVVKVAASVPTAWKLNRRLFNKAMKPYLKASKWIMHASGRLPYFNFVINTPLHFSVWSYRKLAKRMGYIKGNQGPWCDWNNVFSSEQWNEYTKELSKQDTINFFKTDLTKLVNSNQLSNDQKRNLIQVIVSLKHEN